MPITQDRIKSLVEESERNLVRMAHMLTFIQEVCSSTTLSDSDKWRAINANASEYLGRRDCVYTVLERERIKTNWKRNERSADKMRRMRGRRGMGLPDLHKIPPRAAHPTPRMIAPDTHPVAMPQAIPLPDAAFNGPLGPPPIYVEPAQETPSEPSAYDIELARARELGEQERAKNAERLARSATDMFSETGDD